MCVVATSNSPVDDPIISLCKQYGWNYFRGDEQDVLDRFYKAALAFKADIIVRITSDCPLIEAEIIDRVIDDFIKKFPEIDYSSNVLPVRTFPRGLDTEVISIQTLERLWNEDTNPQWREHVTQYIHQNPEKFRIHCTLNDVDCSSLRWTVDTAEDLEFVNKIYKQFNDDRFSWHDVLLVLKKHPEFLEINRHIQQKVVR